MDHNTFDVVTGAFGYTGSYIAGHLLRRDRRVKTITGHPERANPFEQPVTVAPFNFDRPDALVESLRGADTVCCDRHESAEAQIAIPLSTTSHLLRIVLLYRPLPDGVTQRTATTGAA